MRSGGANSGMVQGPQHSTAQHSTAQHSTAQHSTAQHSTASWMTSCTLTAATLSAEDLHQTLPDWLGLAVEGPAESALDWW